MPVNAMKIQCAVVISIIVIASFGGSTAGAFLNYLILMSNVAMTTPIIFLAIAYIFFKRNDGITKPFIVIKSKSFAIFCGLLVILTVGFANMFTILQPALEGRDYVATVFQVAGPVVFSIIALILFRNYEKNNRKS